MTLFVKHPVNQDPIKIHIVCFTGYSGLTDYAISLGRALSAFAEVSLISAMSLEKRYDSYGFNADRIFRRSRHYPIDIFRFVSRTLSAKPKWMIFQGPLKIPLIDGIIARFLRMKGIRVAVTVHDILPHYPKFWSAAEYGFYYRSFDRVIVHSAMAKEAVKKLGVVKPILVIPHGNYDLFMLTNLTREKARSLIQGISPDDCVILFFGFIEPRKGILEFISAAEKAVVRNNRLKFLIAGDFDPARFGSVFSQRVASARKLSNTIIHDSRIPFEHVERYFTACDVVALPYREGTTSGVLKLAIAFGRPVIATRVGDIPEQIPEKGGLLIDSARDISTGLLAAIEKIVSSQTMYEEGIKKDQIQTSWPNIAGKIYKFLLDDTL